MRVAIRDWDALQEVSPISLAAYAKTHGWKKASAYAEHADVYSAEDRPEILIPRTRNIGDYASVVLRLIEIFTEVGGESQLSVYRDLMTADRDLIRVRAGEVSGGIAVGDAVALVEASRDMLLAATCSLKNPRPLYRAGANQEAADFLRRVQMGQTERGSFVVTLLTPVVPPPIPPPLDPEWTGVEPSERKISKRLVEALEATRRSVEMAASGDTAAFGGAVRQGVSANLCEALSTLMERFSTVEVGVAWARSFPADPPSQTVQFDRAAAPILQAAARAFRDRAPKEGVEVVGFVQRLHREEEEADGEISLHARIPGSAGRMHTITAILEEADYERAIDAHRRKLTVIAEGDLHRIGRRWRLRNPRITEVLTPASEPGDAVTDTDR